MNLVQQDIRPELLLRYKAELKEQLNAVLSYWMNYPVDNDLGGFYGSVNNENIPDKTAPKGVVMHSRILWTFSAACSITHDEAHFNMAGRAYSYLINFFSDEEYGGVYWSVDAKGRMLDSKKQIYGQAFCIYGLAEYYKIAKDQTALDRASDLYRYIENVGFDSEKNGYIEAFTREWTELDDLRLSEKDNNERKTMNTHLHIVEAYSNLYLVWPDKGLRERITNLLQLFDWHFINKQTHHLHLFFDDDWNLKSSLQSFGHDIEAAWLLQQCAESIKSEKWTERFRQLAVSITEAAAEGLDADGGLWYEYEPASGNLIHEKHSWPQAEAMIGFYNAYQLTQDDKYMQQSLHSWEFVKKYIVDKINGEWFWGVNKDYSVMQRDKAGFWKCPYHNTRAFIELIKRIV